MRGKTSVVDKLFERFPKRINLCDGFVFLLIFSTLPLFFYKLGQSSLVSFDEAWYADVARNIIKTGNIFRLSWNGKLFNDHPPFGLWLMAISFKIFGVSELSARFVSALLGFVGLIIVYLLGKELFGKAAGFASALVLASSNWYLYRARSGNLDIILTFMFILTFYLGFLSLKDKKYLSFFSLSLAFLFLTKTLVPITIIPALIVIFLKSKLKIKNFILPTLIFILIVGGWFLIQLRLDPNYLMHYFKIGLPGVGNEVWFLDNLKLMKIYLHNGIGRIFWYGMVGIFFGFFTFQKRFVMLTIFYGSFFLPFIFSQKGHIWHLIPLHPIMILSFFGVLYLLLDKLVTKKKAFVLIILTAFYFAIPQIKRNWYEFINIEAFVSDEAILSAEAGKYQGDFYIDEDFQPVAIFYSGKNVAQLHASAKQFQPVFERKDTFYLITKKWRLEQEGIVETQYEIIKKDRDKILVRNRL